MCVCACVCVCVFVCVHCVFVFYACYVTTVTTLVSRYGGTHFLGGVSSSVGLRCPKSEVTTGFESFLNAVSFSLERAKFRSLLRLPGHQISR